MSMDKLLAQRAIELEDDRPKVLVSGRYMRDITDDCLSLLKSANESSPRFFRFGDAAAELVEGDNDSIGISIFTQASLKGLLDRLANFVSVNNEVEKPARPPGDVVSDFLAFRNPSLPMLSGVIQAPIFSESGQLVTKPGYQHETGYYLQLSPGLKIRDVPTEPTHADIARAKGILLDDLLGDFPFVGDPDRAHAVAGMLQRFVRELIDGPTPLHLIESPTPGTGKGLLAETIALPAAGPGLSMMSEGRDEDEWRKRITAKLISAPQFVVIDNLRSRLDSSALSSAITSPIWEDRVLGQSRTVAVPVTCTWMATGNNPALSVEISRRTVSIRLDREVERPWEVTGFRHPRLRRWATENRGDLVWAILTLVQAWIAAGRPAGKETLGSFEEWSEVLGGILDVADIPGFLADRERVHSAAEKERTTWERFCAEWWAEFQDRSVGTDLLFGLIVSKRLLLDVEIWAGRDDHAARTRFGLALSQIRDRVMGDYRIRRDEPDSHNKGQRFHLELRTLRNAAERFAGPVTTTESTPNTPADGSQGLPDPVGAASLGGENVPQPPATLRKDPWDSFLDEADHGPSGKG